jgi:nitroimidazol reductase NimA-like FMN-containing flavoprotein (pyridoxamine 5'-phosphate oxidase superfamily)
MQQNKRVCLQVEEIKNFNHWKSVMVLGDYQELNEERDRYNAIKVLNNNHLQLKEIAENNLKEFSSDKSRSIFYRIIIDGKEGRFENEKHKATSL